MRDTVRHQVLPVSNTREETRATYDRLARSYGIVEGYWERNARLSGLGALAAQPGEHVVEIGFGTGKSLIALARLVGTDGRLEGVDLSPEMVATAREYVSAAGLDARVSVREGDATALPYADRQFDAAFMSFVLELLPGDDIPIALAETLRVLRPGSRVCVVALSRTGRDTLLRRVYEWGHMHFPRALDCRPIYVAESLEGAGFEDVESVRSLMWGLPIEVATGKRVLHRTETAGRAPARGNG
jgi:ubiquinone/menaquinone biosynthesis C-methylase UbiE